MHDARDRVIYVGKAKNLRNRLSSYYSQPLGYTRKMDGLLESIQRIETIQTGSELEALLLESQLILRFQPQFNRQLRNTESYRYIKIDIANPWPRVTLTRGRNPDDAIYFGPFRVARAAKAAVELVNDTFKLRTCPRSFKNSRSYGKPCLQLSLGKCPGPCVGAADRDEYRRTIHEVIGFLRGEQNEAIERIQRQLAEAAEQLDFERAARLRDRMRRVRQLILSQQILDDAAGRGNLVIVTPGVDPAARELLLVVRGRLWAQFVVEPSDQPDSVAARLERAWQRSNLFSGPGVDHDSLDQVHILERWLRKHDGHPSIVALNDEPDWCELIAYARARTNDELTLDRPDDSKQADDPGDPVDSFAEPDAVC
jgi:excinuclease UvrABC nuclease subunit